MNQLIDRWLEVIDVEASTKQGYVRKIGKHIRPTLGTMQVGKLDAEILESFYAQLRKCRDHCGGRKYVQHRTSAEHVCDEHNGPPCDPPNPAECEHARGRAGRTLAGAWQIRAFGRSTGSSAARWTGRSGGAGSPSTRRGRPSRQRYHARDPRPPSDDEAARLVEAAWSSDPDWGAFVWLAMTSGARRGELCALRWSGIDLDNRVLVVRRALFVDDDGQLREKDTKTHQQRRIVLDSETVDVLREHLDRCCGHVTALDIELPANAYVFSRSPDGGTPLIPPEHEVTLTAQAEPFVWELGEQDRTHVRLHVGAAVLYWSAPEEVAAAITVTGSVHEDHHAGVPEDFPVTTGRVRRIRVESRDFTEDPPQSRTWVFAGPSASYREVSTSPTRFDELTGDAVHSRSETGVLVELEVGD